MWGESVLDPLVRDGSSSLWIKQKQRTHAREIGVSREEVARASVEMEVASALEKKSVLEEMARKG